MFLNENPFNLKESSLWVVSFIKELFVKLVELNSFCIVYFKTKFNKPEEIASHCWGKNSRTYDNSKNTHFNLNINLNYALRLMF